MLFGMKRGEDSSHTPSTRCSLLSTFEIQTVTLQSLWPVSEPRPPENALHTPCPGSSPPALHLAGWYISTAQLSAPSPLLVK